VLRYAIARSILITCRDAVVADIIGLRVIFGERSSRCRTLESVVSGFN